MDSVGVGVVSVFRTPSETRGLSIGKRWGEEGGICAVFMTGRGLRRVRCWVLLSAGAMIGSALAHELK